MLKAKIKKLLTFPRILALLALGLLIALSMVGPILQAQSFVEGYKSDMSLQRGMIVRIKPSDATKVEPLTADDIDQMHGVVVAPNDASVTLSSDDSKVFVATIGHYDVLVSNQNGTINPGDYITISSLGGIGMRAGDSQKIVAGKALGSFDGKSNVVSATDVKDNSGKTRQVKIGRIQVDIGIAKNPLLKNTEANIPGFLRRASESIAGKPVNATRVYASIIIFAASTIIAGSLLYSGVRSSIISIGRNPLGKKSILRSLIQVILTGFIIFLSGVFGVYLLLRL
jgi:hypothetical protein